MRAKQFVIAGVLVLFGACAKTEAPAPNKNTNWLQECSTDADCGESLSCLCGVCTHPCDTQAACDGEALAAACRQVRSDELVGQCDESRESGSVCVAACRADDDCDAIAEGSHCERGVCLARMNGYAATGEPDGGGGAGDGGSAGSGGGAGNDGGAGTGVVAGSGGGASSGGSGGVPAELNECEVDADCKVAGDCCSCVSVPSAADVPPSCDATCAEDRCTQLGVSAICAQGRCIFDATCDDSEVTCESLPLECPPGERPLVEGDCWGGGCVDVRDCLGVKSCDACSDDQACVSPGFIGVDQRAAGTLQCWDIEPACDGSPTCECMGSSICAPIQCGDSLDMPEDPIDIGCFCIFC